MKKTLIIAVFSALGFTSCKKETGDLIAPLPAKPKITLTKKGGDVIVTPPNDVDFTFTFKSTADISNVTLNFDYSGTASINNFGPFVCEIVQDSDTSSQMKTDQFAMQKNGQVIYLSFKVLKNTSYTMHLKTRALSGINGKTFMVAPSLYYADSLKTGFIQSSTVTFGLPSVTIFSDPNTPTSKQVVGGAEVVTSTFAFSVQGQDVKFTDIPVAVSNYQSVESINVYDSLGNILGSSNNFSGGTSNVSVNFFQPIGSGTFTVKSLLKPVTSASMSNVRIDNSISGVKYKTPDGTPKTANGSAVSNNMYVFKTTETVTSNSPAGAIQNGVVMTFNTTTISINGPSKKAQKLLSWDTKLTDHGPNVDSIKIFQLGIKVGGVQLLPGTFYFTDVTGAIIDTLLPGNRKIYVTFVNEITKQPGTNTVFELTGNAQGFNHQDGDEFSSTLMMNDTWSTNRFLNSGIPANGVLARSFSSNTPSSSAVVVDYLSSDYSSGVGHSDGLSSGNDWFSSYLIESNISQQIRKK